MDEQTARREIVNIGRLLYERSYVVSSDGNVSVRLDDGRIVATPTMTCKGRMTEESLAVTDDSGKPLSNTKASSELAMHLLIYQERPDVKAVCHAHPPHGTAFAVAGLAIDQPILSEVILTLGCVPLAAYGTPSTDELSVAMRPLVKHHNALLMANHGAVAYGSDLWQAFDRLETLEHTARYLGESARCQACGYLHDTQMSCSTGDRPARSTNDGLSMNGSGKITLTREELLELLTQAAQHTAGNVW
jgi:L-fuculose-phosphate aldolase